MKDAINPDHYRSSEAKCECGRTIECIDITQHLNFCMGNAVKYLWRCGLKDDDVQELKKAIWYIEREIKRRGRNAKEKQRPAK